MPTRRYPATLLALGFAALLILPAAAKAGALTPSPSPLEFTSVPIGEIQVKAVTLTNDAEPATTIGRFMLEKEEPSGQFEIEAGSSCETQPVLDEEKGQSCAINIAFNPTSAGKMKATLVVESDATPNTIEVPLVGIAVAPEFAISPSSSSFSFGAVTIGAKSSAEHFSVENRGSEVGTIEAVTLNGGNANQFEVEMDGCSSQSVGIGAKCSFAVLFAPTSAGSKSASVEVKSDAPESPQTIAVSGTGISPLAPPPAPALAVAPAKPSNAFGFGKVVFNKRRGSAILPVRVPGPGSLLLRGKGLIARRGPGSALVLGAAGTARLAISPAGRKERSLIRTGRAKVVAKVTYIPAGGDALTKAKKVRLVRRR